MQRVRYFIVVVILARQARSYQNRERTSINFLNLLQNTRKERILFFNKYTNRVLVCFRSAKLQIIAALRRNARFL